MGAEAARPDRRAGGGESHACRPAPQLVIAAVRPGAKGLSRGRAGQQAWVKIYQGAGLKGFRFSTQTDTNPE